MKKIIILISTALIISSCSINQNSNPTPVQPPINYNEIESQSQYYNTNDSLTNQDADTINTEPVVAETLPLEQDSDFYSRSIEEALDFCDASQKFREKNDQENALKALDQAYRILSEIPSEENITQQLDDLRYTIAKRIMEIYSTRIEGTKGMAEEIPLTMNPHIEKEIERFTGKERRFFIYSYKRSGKYMPMILEKLKEADLPEELAWLPLIESGFKEKALSHARALGLWQFIPSTGYKFGLKRNLYIDERLDPESSTDAAIAYLKELHSIFGDWSTVLAAYNCGEGRVLRTIKKQNLMYLDNFWDLYLQLPYETARYVPRFIATLHIVKNLEKYGFNDIQPYKSYETEKIFVNKSVHLKDISKAIGESFETLQELNPALRYDIVPPEGSNVNIPSGKKEMLIASIKDLPEKKIEKSYAMHKVRRGETLSQIANTYKTSVKSIMLTNRLSKNNYILPGQLLKIPSKTYLSATDVKPQNLKTKTGTTYYTVKKGDSLWSIARKFNTSANTIKQSNNLNSNLLSIGQKLRVKTDIKSLTKYQVKSGDSPFRIASKHNMSLKRFLNINDMSSSTTIFPGQEVYVE
ncbi:MAG: LysM peptidoglycan-binding domain-containing protein [Desulforegulaceae bacterium]|nr:LysM peptidoglycan-binding domain-containing protein [Desulforegulaceae bacterium]